MALATRSKTHATSANAAASALVRTTGRNDATVQFETQLVEFFTSAADLLGVPKSVAAIYGIVFASPQPITFSEIEDRLNISKGSVSQGLRVLREIGAIKEVSGAQTRAATFAPDLELRKLVARFLESRLQKQLDAGSSRLEILERNVPRENATDAAELQRRLKSLSDWHRKARSLLPLANTVLKLGG